MVLKTHLEPFRKRFKVPPVGQPKNHFFLLRVCIKRTVAIAGWRPQNTTSWLSERHQNARVFLLQFSPRFIIALFNDLLYMLPKRLHVSKISPKIYRLQWLAHEDHTMFMFGKLQLHDISLIISTYIHWASKETYHFFRATLTQIYRIFGHKLALS